MSSDALDRNCPACGAGVGELCHTVIDGEETHWTHDARILADLIRDLRAARSALAACREVRTKRAEQ